MDKKTIISQMEKYVTETDKKIKGLKEKIKTLKTDTKELELQKLNAERAILQFNGQQNTQFTSSGTGIKRTAKERILILLSESDTPLRFREIDSKVGFAGKVIHNLFNEGFVEKITRGVYKITEKGTGYINQITEPPHTGTKNKKIISCSGLIDRDTI